MTDRAGRARIHCVEDLIETTGKVGEKARQSVIEVPIRSRTRDGSRVVAGNPSRVPARIVLDAPDRWRRRYEKPHGAGQRITYLVMAELVGMHRTASIPLNLK